MKEIVNIIRMVVAFVMFALVGGLSPEWVKWGLLGFTLLCLAIKIEDAEREVLSSTSKGTTRPCASYPSGPTLLDRSKK